MSDATFELGGLTTRRLSRSLSTVVRDGRVIATVLAPPGAPDGAADAIARAAVDYPRVRQLADEAARLRGVPNQGGTWDGAEDYGEAVIAGRTYPRVAGG
jgi:hypothetical protein